VVGQEFSAVWGAVAKRLHAHDKQIGVCIETGAPNVSHPWAPRTLPNDTIWHSYMMDWDYPLYIEWADVITNMATYPMMHTTDGSECPTCSCAHS
jgi:hypothetical protein